MYTYMNFDREQPLILGNLYFVCFLIYFEKLPLIQLGGEHDLRMVVQNYIFIIKDDIWFKSLSPENAEL